jgi:hypothetical protein
VEAKAALSMDASKMIQPPPSRQVNMRFSFPRAADMHPFQETFLVEMTIATFGARSRAQRVVKRV